MDEHRLPFDGLHHRRLDGVHHQRAHRAVDLKVGRRDRCAALRVGDDDLRKTLTEIGEVGRHRENRHHLGGNGNVEARVAGEAVELAPAADLDVAETLRTEIHRPLELDALGVDVETLEAALREPGIVVVALVLHARVERDHRDVVRVSDRVHVAREPERKRGERNHLREATACGGTLDVESRAAGRLPDAPDDLLAEFAQALDETEGRRRLAFAQRSRRNRRHVNVLRLSGLTQPLQHLRDVDLRQVLAIGIPLVLTKTELCGEVRRRAQVFFGRLGDLPVLHLRGIKLDHLRLLNLQLQPSTST